MQNCPVRYLHFPRKRKILEEKGQERGTQELYLELQQWSSHIHFIEDEMHFINRLLNSYVFEPTTPNLFERLELFKQNFERSKKQKQRIKKRILEHQGKIAGILECSPKTGDLAYCRAHKKLKQKINEYFEEYLLLKSEIYGYAGSVLKRRKPAK